MQAGNGLRDTARLTQSSYRAAVSEAVRDAQTCSDSEFAEQWGVSAGTVGNARNMNADLAALSLLKLVKEFGPEVVDPVFALVGCKVVARDADDDDDRAALRQAMMLAHQFVGAGMEDELETKPCHTRRQKLARMAGGLIRALGTFKRKVRA